MNATTTDRENLNHPWRVRIYLFLLACLLWLFVVSGQTYETIMEIPLVPVKIRPKKILYSDIPKTAEVRFSGKGKDLFILKYFQPAVLELDLHTINYLYDYPLQPAQVVIPGGLDVTALEVVHPAEVQIILEDEKSRRVPVIARITVNPLAGYTVVGHVSCSPESVTVRGPKILMRQLKQVETEVKVFQKVKRPIEELIGLVLPDPDRMTATPEKVLVRLDVDKIAQRKLTRIPVGAVRVPSRRKVIIEPSDIQVVIQGPSNRLAALTADSIDAFINIANWTPGKKNYPPEFNLPPGLELIRTEPKEVRVRVEVR